ncbi:MAG: gliding motility-associated C-terminal domain-containing protein [Lewinellaceae bacterium]|nr:gliding motility-associated C-terminal domain-containing protein [Lewinellaceae bacterium]
MYSDSQPSVTNLSCTGDGTGSFTLEVQNGAPPYQYSWTSNVGNTGSGTIGSINMPVTENNLPAGTYAVTISELNGGLQTVQTITITQPPVLSAQLSLQSDYNGFGVRCAGSNDGTAMVVVSGGVSPYQIGWSTGAIGSNVANLPAGNIMVTVTDANNCTQVQSANLTAPPMLSLSISTQLPDCGDTLADVGILPSGGLGPYVLQIDGNIVSGFMPAVGVGVHQVLVTDANNCQADSSWTLLLPPSPQIYLPQDTSVLLGESLQLTALTNLSQWDTLYWSPQPDSSCLACLVQNWMPEESKRYTVTIVDTFGCVAQASVTVAVRHEVLLYVPNVFRPDNNGFNDLFQLGAGPGIDQLESMRIFDRWGEMVYEWIAPVPVQDWPGWDGTYRGQLLSPGVYVYLLRIRLTDGSFVDKAGDITITR